MYYAILTDIHANYQALTAVDNDVRQLRHEREIKYWFLGDLVGYGPNPVDCIKWLRGKDRVGKELVHRVGNRWVPGNHDEWLDPSWCLKEDDMSVDAFFSLTEHRKVLAERENERHGTWFMEQVQQAVVDEARSLVVEEFEELTAVFIHASVSPLLRRTTYLKPWEKQIIEAEFMALSKEVDSQTETTVLLSGHTHFPMWATQLERGIELQSIAYERPLPLPKSTSLINPGSVGQPRDGDPRAAYAILDTEAKTIEFRRVEYDVVATMKELRDKGYPESLAERLEKGNGRAELQLFSAIYKKPEWDLQAINKSGV